MNKKIVLKGVISGLISSFTFIILVQFYVSSMIYIVPPNLVSYGAVGGSVISSLIFMFLIGYKASVDELVVYLLTDFLSTIKLSVWFYIFCIWTSIWIWGIDDSNIASGLLLLFECGVFASHTVLLKGVFVIVLILKQKLKGKKYKK